MCVCVCVWSVAADAAILTAATAVMLLLLLLMPMVLVVAALASKPLSADTERCDGPSGRRQTVRQSSALTRGQSNACQSPSRLLSKTLAAEPLPQSCALFCSCSRNVVLYCKLSEPPSLRSLHPADFDRQQRAI